MPEQALPPSPSQKPAPRAPGLAELFEQSLTAAFDPSVFRRAAARPAPSFAAAGGLALMSGAAALAVSLARAAAAGPGLPMYPPQAAAAVGVAALGLYASLLLLIAASLCGLARGLGGEGSFERGLQAAAMISVLAPVQMLCNWFPAAWIAPALLAAWVAAGALEGLFNARPGPARAACALLGAGAIGLQLAGRALADRAQNAYAASQALEQGSVVNLDLARSMSTLAPPAGAAADGAASSVSAPLPTSGLDLLRGGPSDADAPAPPGAPAGGPAPLASAARAMQANAAGMLDAMTPMLDMLVASKTLGPQQKTDVKELQGLMQELKTQMISGKRMDNAVFAAKMARYQALLLRVMSYSAQSKPAAPGASRDAR